MWGDETPNYVNFGRQIFEIFERQKNDNFGIFNFKKKLAFLPLI